MATASIAARTFGPAAVIREVDRLREELRALIGRGMTVEWNHRTGGAEPELTTSGSLGQILVACGVLVERAAECGLCDAVAADSDSWRFVEFLRRRFPTAATAVNNGSPAACGYYLETFDDGSERVIVPMRIADAERWTDSALEMLRQAAFDAIERGEAANAGAPIDDNPPRQRESGPDEPDGFWHDGKRYKLTGQKFRLLWQLWIKGKREFAFLEDKLKRDGSDVNWDRIPKISAELNDWFVDNGLGSAYATSTRDNFVILERFTAEI